MMRPVLNKMGSLMEVKHQWNIDELMDAHEILDAKEDAIASAMPKLPR